MSTLFDRHVVVASLKAKLAQSELDVEEFKGQVLALDAKVNDLGKQVKGLTDERDRLKAELASTIENHEALHLKYREVMNEKLADPKLAKHF
jgi:hypothetical protein